MDQVSEAQGLPIGHDSEIALTRTFVPARCPVMPAGRFGRWSTDAVLG